MPIVTFVIDGIHYDLNSKSYTFDVFLENNSDSENSYNCIEGFS